MEDASLEQTAKLTSKQLTVEDLANLDPKIIALVVEQCTSKDWPGIFKEVAKLKLEQLTLRNCRFSKESLTHLEKSSLKKVTIDNTTFEDYDLVKLRVPTMTHLIMTNNPINRVKQGIPVFQARWQNRQLKVLEMPIPELKTLLLVRKENDQQSVEVTSNSQPAIAYDIRLLKMDLKLVFKNFPMLRRLTLTSFDTGDDQLECLGELRNLRILHIDKCNVSRKALLSIIDNLSDLEEFDITGNTKVNPEVIDRMAKRMRGLKRLFVGNTGITEECGLKLCHALPRLTWLSARQNLIGRRGDQKMKTLLPKATVWAN